MIVFITVLLDAPDLNVIIDWKRILAALHAAQRPATSVAITQFSTVMLRPDLSVSLKALLAAVLGHVCQGTAVGCEVRPPPVFPPPPRACWPLEDIRSL